jgi:hypothetical protein
MRKSSWSRSLVAGVAGAAALLALPSLSFAQEEVFGTILGQLTVPGSGPLTSFDISWVDPDPTSPVHNNYLVADRSHSQVVSIPLGVVNPPSFPIKNAAFPFAGNVLCPDGAANDCAGPDGVLTIFPDPEGTFEIWVGNGPTVNPLCPTHGVACSTVQVFQGFAANLIAVIPTTGSGFPGAKRADELCWAPKTAAHPGRILVANDADNPPYISFIDTDGPNRLHVVKQIAYSNATAGIEQCQFDPRSDRFLLNFPEDSTFGTNGAVHRYDPTTLNEDTPFEISNDDCHHPQGMAIDSEFNPSHVLLGCNGATTSGSLDSVIILGDDGDIFRHLSNQGAADEVWFEPMSHHFFLAEGRCSADCGSAGSGGNVSPPSNKQGLQTLGIFDSAATNPAGNDPLFDGQNVFIAFQGSTTRNAHSVAAWSGALGTLGNFTIAFMPIPATGGATGGAAPYSSTVCGPIATTGCIGMLAVTPIPGSPEF